MPTELLMYVPRPYWWILFLSNNKTVHKNRWKNTFHPFSFSIFSFFFFFALFFFFIVSANFCLLKLSSLICSTFFNFPAISLFSTQNSRASHAAAPIFKWLRLKRKSLHVLPFLVKSNYIDRSFCSGKQPFKLEFNFQILKIDRGWRWAFLPLFILIRSVSMMAVQFLFWCITKSSTWACRCNQFDGILLEIFLRGLIKI